MCALMNDDAQYSVPVLGALREGKISSPAMFQASIENLRHRRRKLVGQNDGKRFFLSDGVPGPHHCHQDLRFCSVLGLGLPPGLPLSP